LLTEVLDGGEQWRNVLPLRLGLANAFRARVAFVLQSLRVDLQRLAPLFERKIAIGVEAEASTGEIGGNVCRGIAE
jgi:hypothetical protein